MNQILRASFAPVIIVGNNHIYLTILPAISRFYSVTFSVYNDIYARVLRRIPEGWSLIRSLFIQGSSLLEYHHEGTWSNRLAHNICTKQ